MMIKNDRGLSLLEVMVSMIVLSIGILGMAPMVVLSVDGNNTSQDVLEASMLAKETIEYYEGLESLPLLPIQEEESALNGVYSRAVSVYDNATDTTLPDGVANLEVVISWIDQTGQSRISTYATLLDKESQL